MRRRSAALPPRFEEKWFGITHRLRPSGSFTSNSGQSRAKTGSKPSSAASTWLRMSQMARPRRVSSPTSMPRSSLPSTSIACA